MFARAPKRITNKNDIVMLGEWDGEPMWRLKTAGEKMWDAIKDNMPKVEEKDNGFEDFSESEPVERVAYPNEPL